MSLPSSSAPVADPSQNPLIVQNASTLMQALLTAMASDYNRALTMRYLTFLGLAILVYDHGLTFRQEVVLVWRARRSFAKYAFLFNRYLVPVGMFVMWFQMSGIVGVSFTDLGCQRLVFAIFTFGVCSIALANCLILMRVVCLWDGNRTVTALMIGGFLISFGGTFSSLLYFLIKDMSSLVWSPLFSMCIATKSTPLMTPVWASSIIFEVLVLAATLLNGADTPRSANYPLAKALHRDGMTYFIALTGFRVLNLSLAATRDPSLMFLAVNFVWAMVTTILNRLLLRLRRMEVAHERMSTTIVPFVEQGITRTPFGGSMSSRRSDASRLNDWDDFKFAGDGWNGGAIEIGDIESVVHER